MQQQGGFSPCAHYQALSQPHCNCPDSISTYCQATARLLLFSMNPTFTSRNECLWIKWSTVHLHGLKCFEVIDLFITSVSSFSISSLRLSLFPLSSPFCSPFSFSFYPGSSISSYFKSPSLHWFSFCPPLLWDFSLLLVRVYFVQQLPHRTVLQFELRLWGNALSDREEGQGGITAWLLIRSCVFPSFF